MLTLTLRSQCTWSCNNMHAHLMQCDLRNLAMRPVQLFTLPSECKQSFCLLTLQSMLRKTCCGWLVCMLAVPLQNRGVPYRHIYFSHTSLVMRCSVLSPGVEKGSVEISPISHGLLNCNKTANFCNEDVTFDFETTAWATHTHRPFRWHRCHR